MKSDNIVQKKSFEFAIRVVETSRDLQHVKKEYVLSKQLLRSGTSIGANIEEAIGGQSRKDFIAKLFISYKEARETKYWISLLVATGYLENRKAEGLLKDVEELLKLLGSILKTSRNNS